MRIKDPWLRGYFAACIVLLPLMFVAEHPGAVARWLRAAADSVAGAEDDRAARARRHLIEDCPDPDACEYVWHRPLKSAPPGGTPADAVPARAVRPRAQRGTAATAAVREGTDGEQG